MNAVVLRRSSWLAFSGVAVVGLGIGMVAAVYHVTSVHGFRDGWQGIPVYLAIAAILGRIANCKVVLRETELLVVNPLRTHAVPVSRIRAGAVGDDGTLVVRLDGGQDIRVFAFGGSVVDRLRGTSGEAARKINDWLRTEHTVRRAEADAGDVAVRWTLMPVADAALVLCVAVAAGGAVWMVVG
ncbi:hypothetical protein ACIQI8_36300 [Streptomyces sp. NPDC092369]|uniref:hypothetical protein n=1 Tax=Streptomyces sp. NPDC092369 TaxID=3366015 RepID=UPI003803C43B